MPPNGRRLRLAAGQRAGTHPLRAAMHFDDEPRGTSSRRTWRGWPAAGDGVPVPAWATTAHAPADPISAARCLPVDSRGWSASRRRASRARYLPRAEERDVCADLRREPAAYATSTGPSRFFFLPRSGQHAQLRLNAPVAVAGGIDSLGAGAVAEQRRGRCRSRCRCAPSAAPRPIRSTPPPDELNGPRPPSDRGPGRRRAPADHHRRGVGVFPG